MTLNEIREQNPRAEIEAVFDGQGDSATVGLYRVTPDDFQENDELPWPSDWPQFVTAKFVKQQGVSVVTA